MDIYILTDQKPDWSAPTGAPISAHLTLDGAKKAFSDGKYVDSWRTTDDIRWTGPDGFGSIIKMDVKQ